MERAQLIGISLKLLTSLQVALLKMGIYFQIVLMYDIKILNEFNNYVTAILSINGKHSKITHSAFDVIIFFGTIGVSYYDIATLCNYFSAIRSNYSVLI